jgi:hypothetical protein
MADALGQTNPQVTQTFNDMAGALDNLSIDDAKKFAAEFKKTGEGLTGKELDEFNKKLELINKTIREMETKAFAKNVEDIVGAVTIIGTTIGTLGTFILRLRTMRGLMEKKIIIPKVTDENAPKTETPKTITEAPAKTTGLPKETTTAPEVAAKTTKAVTNVIDDVLEKLRPLGRALKFASGPVAAVQVGAMLGEQTAGEQNLPGGLDQIAKILTDIKNSVANPKTSQNIQVSFPDAVFNSVLDVQKAVDTFMRRIKEQNSALNK